MTPSSEEKSQPYYFIGLVQEKLGDVNGAISNYLKCLKTNRNHFRASIDLANLLFKTGQGKMATLLFQNAVRAKPESATAIFGLMTAIFQYGFDIQLSILKLQKHLHNDPDNFTFLVQEALLRFWRHEDIKAINLLTRALELKADYIPALTAMGELLRFTGHLELSIHFYN